MKKILLIILIVLFSLSAQALFEVKDASDNTVLEISNDGLRVFNEGDTLMVISSSEIKAFIDSSTTKALSRSFSVTTSAASGKDALSNAFEVTTESAQFNSGLGRYTDFSPENIFIGLNSGTSITPGFPLTADGRDNVFIGNESGINNSSGHTNVFVGNGSGQANTTGNFNVFIGSDAGYSNQDKTYNTFVGAGAGRMSTSYENTFVGCMAGHMTSTGHDNSYIGFWAGFKNDSGNLNTMFGSAVGLCNVGGNNNTIMGFQAGMGSETTNNSDNSILGFKGGLSLNTGSNNVMLGSESGYSVEDGSGNVFLGYKSGYNELGSDKLYIDNSDTSSPLIYGDFAANALTINGTLATTSSATVGANATVNGTYMRMFNNPGTGALPTNYVYQGGSANSTAKEFAFAVNDALWVTSNAYIDGTANIVGNTTIGGNVGIGIVPSSSYGIDVKDNYIAGQFTGETTTGEYTRGIRAYGDGGSVSSYGIYATASGPALNYAGYFYGSVNVTGTVVKSADQVKIDHPLDPQNKFLAHSTVTSDQMMNIYNGNVILDGKGKSIVTMPDWFEAINSEFRYQLTAMGASAPGLYIAKEISDKSFEIAGGKANIKVSWQVTGIRNDNYAKDNPIEVEIDKAPTEKGYYLHPESYGQPKEMGIDHQQEKAMEIESNK